MKIKSLFSKVFLPAEDKVEFDQLHKWSDEAKQNIEILGQMASVENEDWQSLKEYQHVDTAKAWNKVSKEVQYTPPMTTASFLKYAASIILIIGAVAMVYFQFTDTPIKTYSSQEITAYTLEDGSKIDLDKGSIVNAFDNRNIQLSGRAYFDIQSDPINPFTIKLVHGKITVLGTEFTIQTKDKYTSIYVTEGKVSYAFKGKIFLLEVGDYCTVIDDEVTVQKVKNAGFEKWRDNNFIFVNATLQSILMQVGEEYGLKVINENGWQEDNCKINTRFTTEGVEQILNELSILASLKYSLGDKSIIVSSYKCE